VNWAAIVSLGAILVLGAAMLVSPGPLLTIICAAALIGAVLAAVHHAEVVAHRIGEPFGTLVLAVAVTIIEAALILTMMLAGGEKSAALARDAIYAAVMIICTGVIGLCLLVGALRHYEQSFRAEGVGPALAALTTLGVVVLVLPDFTTSAPAPLYARSQLIFIACASLALWAVFIFFQTVDHRDYFLPVDGRENTHATPPTIGASWMAFAFLLVSLIAVVGLAKKLSPQIEAAIDWMGAPQAALGVAIAILVLLPETVAAVRAALANRLQTSMNLALGSALASIGLTVPVVVVASLVLRLPLALGLDPKDIVLLSLALLAGTITLATGRTNLMQGAVHLVLFAAFLFLTLVP